MAEMTKERQGEIAFDVLRQILRCYPHMAPHSLNIWRLAKEVGFHDDEAKEFARTIKN